MHQKSYYSPVIVLLVGILVSSCVDGLMDDKMREELLTLHNTVRAALRNGRLTGQPRAISIKPLKWNMELESKAQSLSDQCRVGHDTYDARKTPEFSLVGQNWAGSKDVKTGFQMWLDEYKNYDYYTRTCRMGQCGHYTQIVWEDTTDVGCGVTDCPNFIYGLSIVCNYGPGGNYAGREPYKIA
ncbi:Venom allergen 5 [Schistosoma japonicum]|nr:Venom allergen 5 [Schistosoma japonicum]